MDKKAHKKSMVARTIRYKSLTNRTKELTGNQRNYYYAILSHIEEFHSFPTMGEIAVLVGVTQNAAHEMVYRLVRKGYLEEWREGKYRICGASFKLKFKSKF